MDQRAPRTAAFSTTVAVMSFIAMFGNAFLGRYPGQEGQRVLLKPLFTGFFSGTKENYWTSTGWSGQEWIWLAITICLVLVAVWGRMERPVPELPARRSVEEQIADFESTSTMVGTRQTTSSNQTTSNIISSIVGESIAVDTNRVESATALLSSGELGRTAAEIVSERNVDIESRLFESELEPQPEKELVQDNRDFVSDGPAYVPLPGVEKMEQPLPLRDEKAAFVAEGVSEIPLPELPSFDDQPSSRVPDMPDLDDLFEESKTIPTMPDLDDLF